MGKLTCFSVSGLELWFNSDDHRPPHFHAEGDSWEVRVYFLRSREQMFVVKWAQGKGPSKADLRQLAEMTEARRDELLAEWEAKVNVKTPGAKS